MQSRRGRWSFSCAGAAAVGAAGLLSIGSPAPRSGEPPLFVSRAITVESARTAAFIAHLRAHDVSAWRKLRARGMLRDHRVYQFVRPRRPGIERPAWNFLLVAELVPGVEAGAYLDAEAGVVRHTPEHDALFKLLRMEVLEATEASYHPTPGPGPAGREDRATYWIEYIVVKPEKAYLDEYRAHMATALGPAFREFAGRGHVFNFRAMETRRVMRTTSGIPDWNQIHIVGLLPENEPIAWATFDSLVDRGKPTRGGSDAIFSRLDSIRTKPREDMMVELTGLRP
jgi:hypothetical protein